MPDPRVIHGDALVELRRLPDSSVDAVITDPPYELGFMGKSWDAAGIAYSVELWAECLRALRPGGHLAAFGGSRTYHRMACAVEDAGFEIRDSLQWIYGSGFPKSLDISKAIDKAANAAPLWDAIRAHIREWRDRAGMTNTELNAALGLRTTGSGMAAHWTRTGPNQQSIPTKAFWAQLKALLGWLDCELDAVYDAVKNGAERPVTGRDGRTAQSSWLGTQDGVTSTWGIGEWDITAPATDAARTWAGWGTALKPAVEPIVLARKPFPGTVAGNVLVHGVGGLNIDATRVAGQQKPFHNGTARTAGIMGESEARGSWSGDGSGRWPSNVLLSHGEECADVCAPGCPVAELDTQSGPASYNPAGAFGIDKNDTGEVYGAGAGIPRNGRAVFGYGDKGGASRFFPTFRYQAKAPTSERPKVDGVAHPTVKPLALMRWLVRLLCPPGGLVLEPFAGSGTTVEACIDEGMSVIGIEQAAEYLPHIQVRVDRAHARQATPAAADQPMLFEELGA